MELLQNREFIRCLRRIIPTEQEITYLSKELEGRDTEQELQIPEQFILLFKDIPQYSEKVYSLEKVYGLELLIANIQEVIMYIVYIYIYIYIYIVIEKMERSDRYTNG